MSNDKGQTLLEVVVVISVVVLVVGALTFATISSLRNATFAKNQSQATKLAQEGLEKVRTGRDRNQCINNLDSSVKSWNGESDNSFCTGSGSIWDYHISGSCDRPDLQPPTFCYFKIDSDGITNIGNAVKDIPSQAEGIPEGNPIFKRVILLSDDLNHDKNFNNDDYKNQKEVTVIVTWKDFSGDHESKLTTILRKI